MPVIWPALWIPRAPDAGDSVQSKLWYCHGDGEIEVVELRIRRTDKTMFVRGRIVKQAGDKVLRIYRKCRGLHGRRSRILKRSEKPAGINKCNRRAAVPEIVIAEESALRID